MAKKLKHIYEESDADILNAMFAGPDKYKSSKGFGEMMDTIRLCKSLLSSSDEAFATLISPSTIDFDEDQEDFLSLFEDYDFDFSKDFANEQFVLIQDLKKSLGKLNSYAQDFDFSDIYEDYENLETEWAENEAKEPYKGRNKSFNEKLKHVYLEMDKKDSLSESMIPKELKNTPLGRTTKEIINKTNNLKVPLTSPAYVSDFWEEMSTLALVGIWNAKFRKIYQIDKNLALDFTNQKNIRLPANALNYIPFKVFYIDLTEIPQYPFQSEDIVGVLVRIAMHKDSCYLQFLFELNVTNDYSIMETVRENKRRNAKIYKTCTAKIQKDGSFYLSQEFIDRLHFKQALLDLPNFLKNKNDEDTIFWDKIVEDDAKAWNTAAKVTLCTIFYICCNNNKTPRAHKSNYIRPVSPNPQTKPAEPDISRIGTNVISLSQEDYDNIACDKQRSEKSGRKHGHSVLVRGHYQHYWIGKRTGPDRRVIYRYKEPYWKGVEEYGMQEQITKIKP